MEGSETRNQDQVLRRTVVLSSGNAQSGERLAIVSDVPIDNTTTHWANLMRNEEGPQERAGGLGGHDTSVTSFASPTCDA